MDQDTSNSPGKARWRERLGMGSPGKELPKISDDFKSGPQPARPATSPPKEAKLPQAANRAPQPVTKPAPMAPRTPPRGGAPTDAGARSVSPIPQGASGLGDRLRAERQAAEKLAEQRVAQARGNSPDRPLQPPSTQRLTPPASERAPEKPKFSFSPEELAKDKREHGPSPEREFPSFPSKPSLSTSSPPPLTPPRPALGGNAQAQKQPRLPPPPPKPTTSNGPAASPQGFPPRFSGPPQPPAGNYRSLDPPPGGLGPKSKPFADTASFRDDPLGRRPGNASRDFDPYRRGPAAYGDDNDGQPFGDYRRSRPPVPARGRRPAYDEDVNEVFEDEEPPRPQRRRASAQDYNRAYRDYDDGYDAEPRRRGPWLWLLAIAAIGLLAAGVIYYYLTYMKTPGQANGNVPVIEAPQQAPKSAPESGSGSTLGTQGSAQPGSGEQKKQIYDRILGDDEAGSNQVVPTQEQPQTVEPTGDNTDQSGSPNQGGADDAMPLPLPPPGDQGSLPGDADQQTAALGTVNKSVTPQPAAQSASSDAPEPTDTGAPVPGQMAAKATQPSAAQPPPQSEQIGEPDPVPAQPVKPKVKVEKKPQKKAVVAVEDTGAGQNDGVAPLVLVPPAQTATPQAQDTQTNPIPVALPDVDQQPKAQTAAVEQKSTSFFGTGSNKLKLTGKGAEAAIQGGPGNWVNSPTQSASAQTPEAEPQQMPQQIPQPVPQAAPQQVASVAPQTVTAPEPAQPAPEQAPPSASGYIAQLASFRSEAEAMAEYDRLRSKHGDVLSGLSPRVVKATVAGASRYRLAVGPLASRSAASKLCTSLIAAGERDCLVRGN